MHIFGNFHHIAHSPIYFGEPKIAWIPIESGLRTDSLFAYRSWVISAQSPELSFPLPETDSDRPKWIAGQCAKPNTLGTKLDMLLRHGTQLIFLNIKIIIVPNSGPIASLKLSRSGFGRLGLWREKRIILTSNVNTSPELQGLQRETSGW